jgi:hypothetical protein
VGADVSFFGNLRLDLAASTNRAALVNVSAQSTCANGFVRVSPSSDTNSLLLRFAGVGFTVPVGCSHTTKLDDGSNTEIVRAWILNGALNN